MGIYSRSTDTLVGVADRDLLSENEHINFEEVSLQMVSECETNYNNIMKAIGINELNYLEENGQDIIYEAVDVRGIFEKIKAFFKKLLDKIVSIFRAFISKMSTIFMSDRDFLTKYEKEFARNYSVVKNDDFKFNGFKFTIKTTATKDGIKGAMKPTMTLANSLNTNFETYFSDLKIKSDISDLDAFEKFIDTLRDETETYQEKIRGYVANVFSDSTSSKTITAGQSFTAQEMSKELFECYRDGESAKTALEKNDFTVADITSYLKESERIKNTAKNLETGMTKGIKEITNLLDKNEKELLRDLHNNKSAKDEDSNMFSAKISAVSMLNNLCKSMSEYCVAANGVYLQALTDKSRQCKAIMAKVITLANTKRESYSYSDDYRSYSEGSSFLDNVVLK